jgi:hypothetical protein
MINKCKYGVFFCLLVFSSCNHLDQRIAKNFQEQESRSWEAKREEALKKALNGITYEGKVRSGKVEVVYPQGLFSQAQHLADQLNIALNHIKKSTGFEVAYDRLSIYLKPVDKIPDEPRYKWNDTMYLCSNNSYSWILYVEKGKESYEEILESNSPELPYVFIHEATEGSITFKEKGLHVLTDMSYSVLGIPIGKKIYYTRWFRDGFSNYTGYLAYESFISDTTLHRNSFFPWKLQTHHHPFSCLSKLGENLFSWHQFQFDDGNPKFIQTWVIPDNLTENPDSPTAPATELNYYDAALGLFLLIRDRYGDEAIKTIYQQLEKKEWVDGPALIRVFNEVLKTDIRQMARDFRFPYLGLYMSEFWVDEESRQHGWDKEGCYVHFVEPGSLSDRAGIKKGDIIFHLNGQPIKTNFDFEMALYKHMDQPSVKLGIWRKGVGEMTVNLKVF